MIRRIVNPFKRRYEVVTSSTKVKITHIRLCAFKTISILPSGLQIYIVKQPLPAAALAWPTPAL